MNSSLADLADRVRRFRDERDWAPFHNPKDLAISISLEAAELLEVFQWKGADEIRAELLTPAGRERVEDEVADLLILLLSFAEATGIDLHAATLRKLAKNAEKYPIDKARGNAKKYDEL